MDTLTGRHVTQRVAQHLVRTTFEDIPEEAVQATKEHILHTLGTVLAGSGAPGCPTVVEFLQEWGGRGESTVLVYGSRLPAGHAALANSTMAHAQEFDNNDDRIAYKSSVCVIPGALAVAERLGGVDGKAFLTAVCLGIDLGIRMGLAIQPQPAHPTAPALGPFAAAAAGAKLLNLDEEGALNALGIALCGVSTTGTSTTSLSYTKRLQAGLGARNGVFAALLAAKGFPAGREIFHGERGYYLGIHKREGNLAALTEGLGERFEVVNVGPKAYPSCRYTHASIDAALALVRGHDLRPEDVAEIRVTVGPRDYQSVFGGDTPQGLAAKQRPLSVVDAQFSIPYTVATAVVRRQVFLDDFTEEGIRDSQILAIAQRVFPVVDPELERWPTDVKPARVEIRTWGGQSYAQRVDYPKGNPLNPVPREEVRANFLEFAARAARPLPEERVRRARDLIEHLDQAPDIAQVPPLLCTP